MQISLKVKNLRSSNLRERHNFCVVSLKALISHGEIGEKYSHASGRKRGEIVILEYPRAFCSS